MGCTGVQQDKPTRLDFVWGCLLSDKSVILMMGAHALIMLCAQSIRCTGNIIYNNKDY